MVFHFLENIFSHSLCFIPACSFVHSVFSLLFASSFYPLPPPAHCCCFYFYNQRYPYRTHRHHAAPSCLFLFENNPFNFWAEYFYIITVPPLLFPKALVMKWHLSVPLPISYDGSDATTQPTHACVHVSQRLICCFSFLKLQTIGQSRRCGYLTGFLGFLLHEIELWRLQSCKNEPVSTVHALLLTLLN